MPPQPRVVRLRAPPEGEGADSAAPRDGVEVRKSRKPRFRFRSRFRSRTSSPPCAARGRLFDQTAEHAVAEEQQGPWWGVLPRRAGARERRRGGGGGGRGQVFLCRRRPFFLIDDDSIEKTNSSRSCCCYFVAFQAISAVARVPARARPRHLGPVEEPLERVQIEEEKWIFVCSRDSFAFCSLLQQTSNNDRHTTREERFSFLRSSVFGPLNSRQLSSSPVRQQRFEALVQLQPKLMRPAEPSQPGSSGETGDAHRPVAAAAPSSLSQQPFRLGRLAFSQVNTNSQHQVNMMTASQDLNVALSGCSLNSQQQNPGKAAAPPPPKWGETPKRQQQQQKIAPSVAPPQHYDEPGFDPPLSQLAPQSQIDAYMLG